MNYNNLIIVIIIFNIFCSFNFVKANCTFKNKKWLNCKNSYYLFKEDCYKKKHCSVQINSSLTPGNLYKCKTNTNNKIKCIKINKPGNYVQDGKRYICKKNKNRNNKCILQNNDELISKDSSNIKDEKVMEQLNNRSGDPGSNKIKHFVITRYFTVDDVYGDEMYTHDFLYSWFYLFKNNLISSLNNLNNKNFELIILIHNKVNKNDILFFDTLQTDYKISIIYVGKLQEYLNSFYDNYDYIVESRIDFDDFVFNDVINDIQKNISDNPPIKLYGYCSGYVYFLKNKKWYNFYYEVKNIGHWGIFSSLIYSTKFMKDKTRINIYTFNHGTSKNGLKKWCKENDIEWSDKMFIQNLSEKAFIYYRPYNSYSEMNHKKKNKKYKLPNYCNTEISLPKNIKYKFGFPYNVTDDDIMERTI